MEDFRDDATEKPMYQTYTRVLGNGKGLVTAPNKVILEYPIQLIQIQYIVMRMLFIKVLQFA